MRPNYRKQQEKELRRLNKEYITAWRLSNDKGYYQEIEPVQRGWIRFFVLRDDIKNRKDARDIQQVLDRINVTIYCHRYDFLTRNWKTKKMVPMEHRLKTLDDANYQKLSEKHKSYFTKMLMYDKTFKRFAVRWAFKSEFFFIHKKLLPITRI
mgnify:CR=1 FL=1